MGPGYTSTHIAHRAPPPQYSGPTVFLALKQNEQSRIQNELSRSLSLSLGNKMVQMYKRLHPHYFQTKSFMVLYHLYLRTVFLTTQCNKMASFIPYVCQDFFYTPYALTFLQRHLFLCICCCIPCNRNTTKKR